MALGDLNGDGSVDAVFAASALDRALGELRPAEIFADGFESGDTAAWSGSVP